MSNSRRLAKTTTGLPPCVVQIHPHDSSICLVGTYQLEEEGSRRGSLDIYRNFNNQLRFESSHPTESSILDVKIFPHDPSLVFSAQSSGSIIAWKLNIIAGSPSASSSTTYSQITFEKIEEFHLFPADVLVLSISFAPEDPAIMSATLSSGEVALMKFANNGTPIITGLSNTHILESWTSTIGSGSLNNVLFSGGDDSLLAAHDMRLMTKSESGVIWMSMKLHDAGITSILPSSRNWMHSSPNYLWTGGYDDQLKAIDLRVGPTNNLESYLPPTVGSSIHLGGGVWRLTPSPKEDDDRVLVCCMYEGARIVSPEKPAVVRRVIKKGHESMVYGADWTSDGSQVITCSFYDKKLMLWSSQEKEEDYINLDTGRAFGEYDSGGLKSTQTLISHQA